MHWNRGVLAATFIMLGVEPALAQNPAPPNDEKPIGILLAAGDIASCVGPRDRHAAERSGEASAGLIISELKEAKQAGIPVKVLALGDIAYEHGKAESFACFNKTWGRFKTDILPVPGNHDYETTGAIPYFKFFSATTQTLRSDDTSPGKVFTRHAGLGFYAAPFPGADGPWLLVGLNSNIGKKQQTAWLNETLGATRQIPCVLAFSHAFYYSSGRHGHADRNGKAQNSIIDLNGPLRPEPTMQGIFQTLVEHRASVMLAGHDHHFEQLGRAAASAAAADNGAAAANDNGVRSFVIGTGGKGLYTNDYKNKWAFTEAIDLKSYGILKLELFRDRYTWRFIPFKDNSASIKVFKRVNMDRCNRAR